MASWFSKRKLQPRPEEETGELNVVPYLDIMMNLIMFMLLSMTGLVTFAVVNVAARPIAGREGPAAAPPEAVTVLISSAGFHLAGPDGRLDGGGAPTVPKRADGSYDFAALARAAQDLKGRWPQVTRAVFGAQDETPLSVLTTAMDACRQAEGRALFPDVALARVGDL